MILKIQDEKGNEVFNEVIIPETPEPIIEPFTIEQLDLQIEGRRIDLDRLIAKRKEALEIKEVTKQEDVAEKVATLQTEKIAK